MQNKMGIVLVSLMRLILDNVCKARAGLLWYESPLYHYDVIINYLLSRPCLMRACVGDGSISNAGTCDEAGYMRCGRA